MNCTDPPGHEGVHPEGGGMRTVTMKWMAVMGEECARGSRDMGEAPQALCWGGGVSYCQKDLPTPEYHHRNFTFSPNISLSVSLFVANIPGEHFSI